MKPILILSSLLLASCVPSATPQTTTGPSAVPFKAGQTWEVVGKAPGSNVEERFSFTLQAPKPSGSGVSFEAERQILSSGNARLIPFGLLYSQTEASVVASLMVADSLSAGPENFEGRNCLVENLKEPIGNKLEGRYHSGKVKEFTELGKAKDYSKFGSCTLVLK